MEENHFTVYCHINKINGKRYIGMTGSAPEERWANGNGYKTQFFGKAVKAHGWENFEHLIIATGLSEEDAAALETELIMRYQCRDKRFGYNVCEGGKTSTTGVCYGEEVRKNMSEAQIKSYQRDPSIKKKISDGVKKLYNDPEYAEKMRELRKSFWERPGYREHQIAVRKGQGKGRVMSAEAREKIRLKNIGKKRSEEICKRISEHQKKIAVAQLSADGELIAVFRSMAAAQKQTGISSGNISLCCAGKRPSAGGYQWQYAKEDNNGADFGSS